MKYGLPLLSCLLACHSAPPAVEPQKLARIDAWRAEELVRAEIFRQNPEINPAAQFQLNEISPSDAWEVMGVQLFQIDSSATVQACETFAVRKGEVARLGTGFGGMGVGSTLVTDVDGDHSPDLVFVYSWGSGRHRSQVGVLRIAGDRLGVFESEWSCDGDAFLWRASPAGARLVNNNGPFGTLRVVEGALRVVAD